MITEDTIREAAYEITRQAAIRIPQDYRSGIRGMRSKEQHQLSCFVLDTMMDNWDAASGGPAPNVCRHRLAEILCQIRQ